MKLLRAANAAGVVTKSSTHAVSKESIRFFISLSPFVFVVLLQNVQHKLVTYTMRQLY